jgi:hypothetical protein
MTAKLVRSMTENPWYGTNSPIAQARSEIAPTDDLDLGHTATDAGPPALGSRNRDPVGDEPPRLDKHVIGDQPPLVRQDLLGPRIAPIPCGCGRVPHRSVDEQCQRSSCSREADDSASPMS